MILKDTIIANLNYIICSQKWPSTVTSHDAPQHNTTITLRSFQERDKGFDLMALFHQKHS